MSSPRLSICIPTFDRLGYLKEAVRSAREQTLKDIEIVIGDDGDSADLRSWCEAEVAADARVRYEKTPRRLGLAGNWNFLAGHARGQYLTLMGDDDRLLPAFAETLLEEAAGRVDVVFCNHFIIDGTGRRLDAETRETTRRYARSGLARGSLPDPQRLVWQGVVPMSAAAVRAAEVRRYAFKNDINTPELELFVRMAAAGASFAFVDDYLAEYRAHAGSATTGGLTIDRLAEYLAAVEVPADIEPMKRECLQPLVIGGVGVRLGRGDVEGARALRESRYYPRAVSLRSLSERLIMMLPTALAARAYALLRDVNRALRRSRMPAF